MNKAELISNYGSGGLVYQRLIQRKHWMHLSRQSLRQ